MSPDRPSRHPNLNRCIALYAGLAVLGAISCSDDPLGLPGGLDRLEPDGPLLSQGGGGSFGLTIPPANMPIYGTLSVEWTEFDAPENPDTISRRVSHAWWYFQITGEVHVQQTPHHAELCDLGAFPSWACPPPYDGATWGPRGGPMSALGVILRQNEGAAVSPMLIDSVEANTYVHASYVEGATWEWARNRLLGSYSCGGGYPGCPVSDAPYYNLTGSQQMVTGFRFPQTVSGATNPAAGDTVVFEASGGEPSANNVWRFRANDTLPSPAGWGGSEVVACAGSETCSHLPSAPGRMYMQAWYSPGGTAYSYSEIVWPGRLDLDLSCSPEPVTRGEEVACHVSRSGGMVGDESITWTFSPDSLIQLLPDSSVNPGLSDVIAPEGDTLWAGPAVHPGIVHVEVVAAGYDTATASAGLTISRRTGFASGDTVSWDEIRVRFESVPDTFNQNPGVGFIPRRGANLNLGPAGYGSADWQHVLQGGPSYSEVPAGPNSGYWYVWTHTVHANRGWEINRTWTLNGDTLGATALNHWNFLASDSTANPTVTLAFIEGHEKQGNLNGKGHQGQIELVGKDIPSCGNLPYYLEPIVAPALTSAEDFYLRVYLAANEAMVFGAGHNFVWGNAADPNAAPSQDRAWFTVLLPDSQLTKIADWDTLEADTVLNEHPGCMYGAF
jgi:hypothetical protein